MNPQFSEGVARVEGERRSAMGEKFSQLVNEKMAKFQPGDSARVANALLRILKSEAPKLGVTLETWVDSLVEKRLLRADDKFEAVEILGSAKKVEVVESDSDLRIRQTAERLKRVFGPGPRVKILDDIVRLQLDQPMADVNQVTEWVDEMIAKGEIPEQKRTNYIDVGDRLMWDAQHDL